MMFLTVEDLDSFAQFLDRVIYEPKMKVLVDDYFVIQVGGDHGRPRAWELGAVDSLGGLQYRLAEWVSAMRAAGQHDALTWALEEGSLIQVHQ